MLSDVLGSDPNVVYGEIEEEVDREVLSEALSKLNSREKQIMDLRFGLDGGKEFTQKEVADMLGISQSYISRLEKKILERLRKEILQKMG
jgi:RNA polymerase sporulation-specific sigma factor